MEIRRTFDILEKLRTNAPKQDILNAKEDQRWVSYSAEQFIENANNVSAGLLDLGFRSGDKVAIMAGNMPRWNFVDYGCQQAGIVTAPIFPTISNDDLRFILNHCEAKAVFISEKSALRRLQEMREELPHLKFIFAFQSMEGAETFEDLLRRGEGSPELRKLAEYKATVKEDDLFTILYTSGTTGVPKGVMLSHRNLLSNVFICQNIAPFTNQWRALSFLPLNHVYERFLNTLYLFHGVSIYYAESFETIGDNCREIRPQIFVAVPRVLERVLDKITSAGEKLQGFKKQVFDWSMRLAEKYELSGKSPWYHLQRMIADKLVYSKWRAAVGGEVVAIVSGGAALNPRLERIFYCAGLNLLQGYGLTETCVVVSVNRFEKHRRRFGTVGIVVENSEVRIAEEDGEILFRGPSLMLGYYRNEDATAEVIDQHGWFHTGDIGAIVEGRFLKITDRKKEIFKNSGGKYISPVAIENRLKECKYIEQCMVVGEGQKFVSAIIIPSFSAFRELAALNGWVLEADLLMQSQLRDLIAEHVKKVNAQLAPYEQLKRYQLIDASWAVDTGEITPKLSLRRKVIQEKNRELIAKIFRDA